MKKIKETLKAKFMSYGCRNYKQLIAEESGYSIQYVRKFFRVDDWPHEEIERAAKLVLARKKRQYEARLNDLKKI